MKCTFTEKNTGKTPVLLPLFQEDMDVTKRKPFRHLTSKQRRSVKNALRSNIFPEAGSITIFSVDAPVVLHIVGKKEESHAREMREAGELAFTFGKKWKYDAFLILDGSLSAPLFVAYQEGVLLGSYEFLEYKGKKKGEKEEKKVKPTKYSFWGKGKTKEIESMAAGVTLCKDIINMPPSDARPSYLEKTAKEMTKRLSKLSLKVVGEKELTKIGCGGIVGVGRGSNEDSRLLLLEYKGGKKGEKPVALVGKGVTFDTGGHNIKGRYMRWMKQDLGGAATVLGAMEYLAAIGVKKNVLVAVPAVENMVSADAYFPDDILTMYNGMTVEVDNTDAEGRLILADALAYVDEKYSPRAMVDLATLTGACAYAVGDDFTAGLTNNAKLFASLKKASEVVDEPLWELPLHQRYKKALKSSTADIVNCSSGLKPGTIEGGLFLQNFVNKDTPWCHLDIASVAFDEKIGLATGRDVRLLVEYVKNA